MQKKEKTKKENKDKFIGTPIKEYRLPLSDYIAYYLPFLVWFFWSAVTAMIVAPTIIKNYENFWYYLGIAPVAFFFVMGCINWVRFIHHAGKYHSVMDADAEADDSYENHTGAPGTCKSLTAKERSSHKAIYSWEEIKFLMWLITGRMKDPNYVLTDEDKEVIDAFEFTIKNEGIPLLATSIPAYDKRLRRYSYELELEHLRQEKRLPYRCVLWQDEIGTALNFSTAWDVYAKENSGSVKIDDFARYIRHFGEFRLIGTEQDGANISIFMKRIASDNKLFESKDWVLKPRFLLWLYKKLKKRFTRRMVKSEAYRYGRFMSWLKNFVYKCGFFKITYKSCGNYVTNSGGKSQTQVIVVDGNSKRFVYYLPRMSPVVYETRAMSNGYEAKNKPIELKVWKGMKPTEEQARKMLKSDNLAKMREEAEKKKEEKENEKKSENLSQSKKVISKKKSTDEVMLF